MLRHFLSVASLAAALSTGTICADEPPPIGAAEFEKLFQLVKPHAGESRWMEIDWYPNIWEARRKAAAEGKPIFIMAGTRSIR